MIDRANTDFPLPLSPTIPTISPRSTVTEAPSTAANGAVRRVETGV